ncbi:MAG: hypothetical protein LBS60_12625, partial [Deltaproteobacteria bacterium]|nr:hypothetical protein [Deltaproteobacteria bacterium]
YAEAVVKLQNGEEIDHPNLAIYVDEAQQVMTIGLIMDIISGLIAKTGEMIQNLNKKLSEATGAFWCKTMKRGEEVVERVIGGQPEKCG